MRCNGDMGNAMYEEMVKEEGKNKEVEGGELERWVVGEVRRRESRGG